MANEIIGEESAQKGKVTVVMFSDIPPGDIHQVNGVNVIPTPSALLPKYAAMVADPDWVAKCDAGTAFFVTDFIDLVKDETQQETVARFRTYYEAMQPVWLDEYIRRYQYAGLEVGAVAGS